MGISNSAKAAGIVLNNVLNTSCMPERTNKGIHLVNISLKRINVILYKRWRISCFLPYLLERSKISHGHYSKINHSRSQSVMRNLTLLLAQCEKKSMKVSVYMIERERLGREIEKDK